MMENNIRFKQIGRLENLPDLVLDQMKQTLAETAGNDGLQLNLALNYGSRAEITDAVRAIAAKVAAGKLDPRDIREQMISDHLYTAGMPDPDLLIRTAGEMRVSNYLLWQISYAELVVSPVLWPDFTIEEFHKAPGGIRVEEPAVWGVGSNQFAAGGIAVIVISRPVPLSALIRTSGNMDRSPCFRLRIFYIARRFPRHP